ncbi:SURF1 family protein [Phyllobacterium salinisoli]|uniref:SURF1-like protein n=1 Tax=Phyllobacterium salinisoli TaxID=1899321 RepID=A0A368K4G7_9HYPH|nr:SURF1 family protein [Phyllobacterium salinisoli]RCS23373.1 SURF1 family protein [Phyllobacterium salinisoli]
MKRAVETDQRHDNAAPAGRFPWLVPALIMTVALAVFAILIALGTWQVQRLHWKEGLVATIAERVASPPRPIDQVEAIYGRSGDVEYWPVEVTGRFLHQGERHFFATHQGRSGFYVYTPLQMADGRAVLVNRGFVPYDSKEAGTRAEGQVAGDVTVKGLARDPLAEKPSSIVPDNDPTRNIFYWKNWPEMVKTAGLDPSKMVPFFIDADTTPNPGGLPLGGVTIIDLPNNHLQYAVTWYGLALALAAVVGAYLWRWRSSSRKAI